MWANFHLEKRGIKEAPLETHFSDSGSLVELISVVSSGKSVPKISFSPPVGGAKSRSNRVSSLAALVDYLRKDGVSIPADFNMEGLIEGELSAAMKLAWRIIIHYQISGVAGLLKVPLKDNERNIEKAFLEWISKRIGFYPNISTKSLSKDVADGLLFCALLHKQNAKAIKWQVLDKTKRETNLELAFRGLREHFGIPALLDTQDLIRCEKPDKKSVMVYVSMIIQAFERHDLQQREKQAGTSPLSPREAAHISPSPSAERDPLAARAPAAQSNTLTGRVPDSLKFSADQLQSMMQALSMLQDQSSQENLRANGAAAGAAAAARPKSEAMNRVPSPPQGQDAAAFKIPSPKERPALPKSEPPSPAVPKATRISSLEALFQPGNSPTASSSPPPGSSPADPPSAILQTPPVPVNIVPPAPERDGAGTSPARGVSPDAPDRAKRRSGLTQSAPLGAEPQRLLVEFSRNVAVVAKELKSVTAGGEFDASKFAKGLTEAVKSARSLVPFVTDAGMKAALAESMKSVGGDGRRFVEVVRRDTDEATRAAEVDAANRDLTNSLQQLAVAVKAAFQSVRAAEDPREAEERLRAFHKSLLDNCKRVWAYAQTRPLSSIDENAFSDDLDRLQKGLLSSVTLLASNTAQQDTLVNLCAHVRAAAVAYTSAIRTFPEAAADVPAAEAKLSSTLENFIQTAKAAIASELQAVRAAAPASRPQLSIPLRTSAGSNLDKFAMPTIPQVIASPRPGVPLPRLPSRSADNLPGPSARRKVLFESLSALSAIENDAQVKAGSLSALDLYRLLRSVIGHAVRAAEVIDPPGDQLILDWILDFGGAMQTLLSTTKGGGADNDIKNMLTSRVLGVLAVGVALLREEASDSKCSICSAKLTAAEMKEATDAKRNPLCKKCAGPLGGMQNTLDELFKSVQ